MPVSVLEIDVNDAKFQQYKTQFDRYQQQVNTLPDAWAKVGSATEDAGDGFTAMVATLMAQQEILLSIVRAQEAATKATGDTAKAQGAFGRAASASGAAMTGMVRTTRDVASNVKAATESLLKWVGVTSAISGLIGAGGLFGIDRLAMGAAGAGRHAGGIGTSVGADKAFSLDYSRFFDADSVLGNVVDAKSDLSKRWVFGALGINNSDVQNMDPAELAATAAERAKSVWAKGDGSAQYAQSQGLDRLFSMDDLRRLGAASPDEMAQQRTKFERDRADLNLDQPTTNAWQNLEDQLRRAGETIETVFVRDLTPLAPGLEHLSDAFTKAVDAFLSNPQLEQWLKDFAGEIQELATYLGRPEIKDDIDDFLTNVERFAKAVGTVAEDVEAWFGPGHTTPPKTPEDYPTFKRSSDTPGTPGPFIGGPTADQARPAIIQGAEAARQSGGVAYSWDAAAAAAAKAWNVPTELQRDIYAMEGGLKPDGSPAISPHGAIGIGQLTPATAQTYHVDPYDLGQNIWGSTHMMSDLLTKYHGDWKAAAAAYNAGPNSVAVSTYAQTHDESVLPDETRKYVDHLQRLVDAHGVDMREAAKTATTPGYATQAEVDADRVNKEHSTGMGPRPQPGRLDATVRVVNQTGAQVSVSGAQVAAQ